MESRTLQDVQNIVNFIEHCIASKKSFDAIKKETQLLYYKNYETIRRQFKNIYGLSLIKYIRRRLLTVIYQEIHADEKITEREIRYGIKNIPLTFSNEFGKNIRDRDLSIMDLQPRINSEKEIQHYMIPYINDTQEYKIMVSINDERSIVKRAYYLYSLQPYILHESQVEGVMEYSGVERATIALEVSLDNLDPPIPFYPITRRYGIPESMIQTAKETCDFYDWNNPHQLTYSYMAYTPYMPEEMCKPSTKDLNSWLNRIYTPLPDMFRTDEQTRIIATIPKSQSLEEISEHMRISLEEARWTITDYLNKGILRIM